MALTHPFGLGLRVLDADAAREVGRAVARLAATPLLTQLRADGGVADTSADLEAWYASSAVPGFAFRRSPVEGRVQPLLDALHQPALTLRHFVLEVLERGQPYTPVEWPPGVVPGDVSRPSSNLGWTWTGLAGRRQAVASLPLYAATLAMLPDAEPGTIAAFTDLAAGLGVYARSVHGASLRIVTVTRTLTGKRVDPPSVTAWLLADGGAVPVEDTQQMDVSTAFKPGTMLLTTWDTFACGLECRNLTVRPGRGGAQVSLVLGSTDNKVRPLLDAFREGAPAPAAARRGKSGRKGGAARHAAPHEPAAAGPRVRGTYTGADGRRYLWAAPPPWLNTPEAIAAAGEALAGRIAARQLGVALLQRIGGEGGSSLVGSSLEHAVALSGVANGEGTPLYATACDLRDEAGGALAGDGRDAVASALTQVLTAVVPPPEPPAGTPPSDAPALRQALLAAEVSSFVADLLEVLRLVAASVPVDAAGRTPLDACHKTDARDEAWASLLVPVGTPITLRLAIEQAQQRREEARTTARELPPHAHVATYALLALGGALLLWASYGAAATVLPAAVAAVVALLSAVTGVSGVLTALTGLSAYALAADPDEYTARVVRPLHSLYLTLSGRPRVLLDAQQAAALRARCEALVRAWGVRRLKARLARAVNKPALTAREVAQLTDEIVAVVAGAQAAAGDAGITRTPLTPAQAAAEGVEGATGEGAATHYVAVEGALPDADSLGPLLKALGDRDVDEDDATRGRRHGGRRRCRQRRH